MTESKKPDRGRGFASPPCLAHEIDPTYFDPLAVDPDQTTDVTRWRKAKRRELRDLRKRLTVDEHSAVSSLISVKLEAVLHDALSKSKGRTLSMYWPIKGEPDLRPLMEKLHNNGVTIALPIVETKAAPLVFRVWTPDTKMVRGDWNILVPPADAPPIVPDVVLAPLVGWDCNCFRLGYGGGYFDRTLAVLAPAPFRIGIGFEAARLPTIYPQPHDIALDLILTEMSEVHADRSP